ncbi:MAG: oligoendopeptidase F [Lachnospiraceae bacterium]
MAKELASRSQVPKELTWDLSLIYETEEEMYADAGKMQQCAQQIEKNYKGRLTSPEAIAACAEQYQEVYRLATLTSNYTDLAVSVDFTDGYNQERNNRINQMITEVFSQLSFIPTEIGAQDDAVIEAAIEKTASCARFLRDILREKPHQLQPETERVLAALSHTINLPYEIYNTAKLADMKFDNFEVNGESFPLGYSLFENNYEYDTRTDIRRAAFDAFSKKIKEYENVTAAAYNGQVQYERVIARLRNFDNIFEKDLFQDKVTLDLYHRQINLIMDQLAPHMRKYACLLKRIHHLDKMTFADLKLPVDADYSPSVTIQKSREYIEKGLSIMGEDYVKMIQNAYDQRWIDFAQNHGKSTGGFCASPYGKGSFILLSWHEKMSDVFTLAHELGHAGHFRLCNEAQSLFDTSVSGYFVEAPSTMNELLMAHYMLKTSDDKRFRRWVLANMVGNTYYHNFVTHLLEAAYQREVYNLVDAGGSVQADTLSKIMRETLERFWGDAVEINEGAELTWMRQPHYYMGLYSYSYSAGLTIATQMCKRIENEGESAIEDWKKVLKAGSTLTPVELAALAGIDITTDKPLLNTIEIIGGYIDEICRLTEELTKE